MKSVCEIIDEARSTFGCNVEPPSGLPSLPEAVILPADLNEFYTHCGGIDMFPSENWGWRILKPSEFQRADIVLFELAYQRNPNEFDGTPSQSLFMIAVRGCGPDYISIDTHPSRAGRCYDAFHDIHATESSQVLALSFTELLNKLFGWRQDGYFWEDAFYGYYGQPDTKLKLQGRPSAKVRLP